jgi:biopolymer transport protein ExbD
MKLSSRKIDRERRIELSMTSMIDVVFLLLIFFMVASSFIKTERQLEPAIKVKNKSVSQATTDMEPAIVDVVQSGNRSVYKLGSLEMTSDQELVKVLDRFQNKMDGAVVRVADDVPFFMAAAAIQACKSAKFVKVSYVPLPGN